MRFMMIIYSKDYATAKAGLVPDFKDMERMGKYNEELGKAGVLRALDGLTPPATMSARVTFKGGKSTVTDGPFTETKEVVGGFYIIEVNSREEALEWASRIPGKDNETIEVRRFLDLTDFPADIQKKIAERFAEGGDKLASSKNTLALCRFRDASYGVCITATGKTERKTDLCGSNLTNLLWWYNDLDKSCPHIVDEAGDKPPPRQCGSRPEQSDVGGNGRTRIGDRFCLQFPFLHFKIARQHGGLFGEVRDTAIGMLEDDEMKLPATSRNRSGNLADSPEHTQLLQQPWRDSTADVTDHNGFPRFNSEYMSRVHTHIGATDNNCLHIRQRTRHKFARRRLASGKIFITFQHGVESGHIRCPPPEEIQGRDSRTHDS